MKNLSGLISFLSESLKDERLHDGATPCLTAQPPTRARVYGLDSVCELRSVSRAQRWSIGPHHTLGRGLRDMLEREEAWHIVREEDRGKLGFAVSAWHAGSLWILLADLSNPRNWMLTARRIESLIGGVNHEDKLLPMSLDRGLDVACMAHTINEEAVGRFMIEALRYSWEGVCSLERTRIAAAFVKRAEKPITTYEAEVRRFERQLMGMGREASGEAFCHIREAMVVAECGIAPHDVLLGPHSVALRWRTVEGTVATARCVGDQWDLDWIGPQVTGKLGTRSVIDAIYHGADVGNQMHAALHGEKADKSTL